jgi:hypothetical protein
MYPCLANAVNNVKEEMMKTLATISLATAMALTVPAYAQQAPAAAAAAPNTQQVQVDNQHVKEFVKVHQEVYAVNQKYQQKLKSAKDSAEVNTLSQKANQEMKSVVDKSPLSIDQYNQYAMLLQQDKSFQQKYQQYAK